LNLNFHGPTSTKLLQRNLPIIVAALRTMRDRYDCDFRYFVHFEASLVVPRLLALEGIKMDVVQGSPQTLLRHYADVDLHIGGMLHSCILAHSVGTPAIALAYDIKHRGFMELFGLERDCLSASGLTSSELLDRVDDALENLASHQLTIEHTRKRLEGDTHRFARKFLGT
jgi:polysaccharide pyruvyl transferase WcaK-like protein